jgi:hypothetical protein
MKVARFVQLENAVQPPLDTDGRGYLKVKKQPTAIGQRAGATWMFKVRLSSCREFSEGPGGSSVEKPTCVAESARVFVFPDEKPDSPPVQ